MKKDPLITKKEMNPRKKQMVIAVIAIALAILIGFAAYPYITANQQERVQVVTAVTEIPAKTQITAEMVAKTMVFKSDVPEGIVSNVDELTGKFTKADIFAGDYLTQSKVVDSVRIDSSDISGATAKGLKVISITLPNLASSVSGKIMPGDIVSIMSIAPVTKTIVDPSETLTDSIENKTESDSDYEQSEIPLEFSASSETQQQVVQINDLLRYVEVCSLSLANGADAIIGNAETSDSESVPATVSLFVTDEQAEVLLQEEQKDSIHLLFVARGADRLQYMTESQLVGGE